MTFILLSSSTYAIHTISITCKYFKEFRTHIGEVPVCFVVSNDSILYDETYITSVSHSNKTLTKDSKTKHFATLNKFYQSGHSNVLQTNGDGKSAYHLAVENKAHLAQAVIENFISGIIS